MSTMGWLLGIVELIGAMTVRHALSDDVPSIADLRAFEKRVKSVRDVAVPATVAVRVGGGLGSGVIVTPQGVILTAGHVYDRTGQRAHVTLHDGRQVRGRTLPRNIDLDIGAIALDDPGPWPYVQMGNGADVETNDFCVAIGHPGGYEKGRPPVFRLGRVTRLRRDFLRTSNPIISGDSGGPLLDLAGRVIGIHSRILRSISGNLHVPIQAFRKNWGLLMGERRDNPPRQARMGIEVEEASRGCRVTKVMSSYPVARSGLLVGDILVSMDGVSVDGADELVRVLASKVPGDVVKVQVLRNGSRRSISVTLGEYK